MYRTFILWALICVPLLAQSVIVKDSKSGKPLELVSVYTENLNKALTTDSNGRVYISAFKNSNKIFFRLIGYKTLEIGYNDLQAVDYTVLLNEETITLGSILVNAKRWEEELKDIPQNVEVIGLEEIRAGNSQTTADLLSQTGNVYVQKSQLGGGSPMIRGFSTNRVLIVVDDVRMNNAIFRSGNLQNVISIDPNSLANAHVVFGPGSVIYGSDAIGGVMDFHTMNPNFSYSDHILINGSANARYSSANNENTGHINVSFGLQQWAFLSSLTNSKFDDLRMGSDGPSDYLRNIYQNRINGKDTAIVNPDPEVQKLSGYDQWNFMQKIRFKPEDNWEFNYGFHYSTTSDVPRYDRLIELKNGLPRDAQWYYGPQKWMMNNLTISDYSSNSFFDLGKAVIAHQRFEESRHNRSFGKSTLNHRTEQVNAFSLNFDFIKNIRSDIQIFYGLEHVANKISSKGHGENIKDKSEFPISTRYPDGSVWNSYGLYFTYKNKFNEKMIFQGGLRYNLVDLSSEFDTSFFPFPFQSADLTSGAFTGSAGLVWNPEEDLQINVNLSTGFRAPNIDDVGKVFDSVPGSVIIPNPDLKSEYIYSAELGISKVFLNKVRIKLDGFYSYLDDALVRRNFSLNGAESIFYDGVQSQVQAIQNSAFAYVWGLQSEIEFAISEGFKLVSKFSYQKGEEEDDDGNKVSLRHAAPWYGTTQLVFNKGIFNINLYADYNGEISYKDLAPTEREKTAIYAKDKEDNPYSPSWYTINIRAGIVLPENVTLGMACENITDQRYRTYSSGISAAGRNFIGSIRYTF